MSRPQTCVREFAANTPTPIVVSLCTINNGPKPSEELDFSALDVATVWSKRHYVASNTYTCRRQIGVTCEAHRARAVLPVCPV